jgi:hypothetical protein
VAVSFIGRENQITLRKPDYPEKTTDLLQIRVITKLPNTEQSFKGKGNTHKSTNRQYQSTTVKLGKPQWP